MGIVSTPPERATVHRTAGKSNTSPSRSPRPRSAYRVRSFLLLSRKAARLATAITRPRPLIPRTTVSVLELHHAAHVLLSGKGGTRNCRQGDPVRPMTTAQMVRRMRPAARSQHLSIHHHYESDL